MFSRILKPLTGSYLDQGIISDLQKGGITGRKAEDELFKSFSYYIADGMRKYGLREDDAFDAYSDSILSTINAVVNGKFEERSSLKTYIYRVFHHKCVDIVRKNTTNKESVNKSTQIPELLSQLSDTARSVVQKLIDESDMADMRQKLERIGENCRTLLLMFAEGFSDKEIAASMEYNSAEVVKTSRLRCLQKLRVAYSAMKKL